MHYIKFAAKLFGTHLFMTFIMFFMSLLFFSILTENEFFQWSIGLGYVALFWFVIYADVSNRGEQEIKRGTYFPLKGFIAGLIATIPTILLIIISFYYPIVLIILRLWLIPYIRFFIVFDQAVPYIAFVAALLFPLVVGFSYMDGPRKWNKIRKTIEKSQAQRVEKSKTNK